MAIKKIVFFDDSGVHPMTPNLRLVRSAPDPLGLYIRVTRVGSPELQSFIATRPIQFSGVVLEAKLVKQQKELLTLAQEKRIDVVLDPMAAAMAHVRINPVTRDTMVSTVIRPAERPTVE